MDYDAWILWAEAVGIHSTVYGFLKQQGSFVGSTADRWERVSTLLKSNGTIDLTSLQNIMRGMVGDPGTSQFIRFKQDVDANRIQLPILGLILPFSG